MVTRRCSQRTFRLKPSDETNAIWIFCLALAAERSGVQICAVCVMSNHCHGIRRATPISRSGPSDRTLWA
jgi:REP element-mobilizing transposase RayT